jgi:hypothetical protein
MGRHTHTDWWEGFRKYAAEMGTGVHTKFHKDWFRHSKVNMGDSLTYILTDTDSMVIL